MSLPFGKGEDEKTIELSTLLALLDLLDLRPGEKVLEVGTGSGYLAAILKTIVGKTGQVITIECKPNLVCLAKSNLKKLGYDVQVIQGDGTLGYPPEAPYDRIIVTANFEKVPAPLKNQLKIGGIMIAPIYTKSVRLILSIKKISKNKFEEVEYYKVSQAKF
jgi:protein-L-isoaspartate(D-aspartate) O-methyltransferase